MDEKKKKVKEIQQKCDSLESENRQATKKVAAAKEKQETAEKEAKTYKD